MDRPITPIFVDDIRLVEKPKLALLDISTFADGSLH
jgi:hypothetical protein